MLSPWKKIVAILAMFILGFSIRTCRAQDAESVLSSIREKYDKLGPKSKFAVGAAGGFVATRIALGTAMTAVKVGALAYVTSEVLHQTGLLDVKDAIADFRESNLFKKAQVTAANSVSNFRVQVRKTFRPMTVQELFEKERMATLGGASGIVVGLLL
ncbi:hypothetical protein ACA910_016929 [Epithemia clementina (nom. ined.)]